MCDVHLAVYLKVKYVTNYNLPNTIIFDINCTINAYRWNTTHTIFYT